MENTNQHTTRADKAAPLWRILNKQFTLKVWHILAINILFYIVVKYAVSSF